MQSAIFILAEVGVCPKRAPALGAHEESWRPRMRFDHQRNYRRRDRTGGFSLIEILIVVFVVMVVAAIAVPNMMRMTLNLTTVIITG